MKTLIRIIISICLSANVAFAQSNNSHDGIIGTWLVQDGTGKVKIEKINGKFCGKLVWINNPTDKNGKSAVDSKNPDKGLQNRPLVGLKMLENFTYDSDNVWTEGTIYDPDGGKTYSCKITLKDNGKMEVRGYVGISLFGRTDTWTRVQDITMK
jgi:uncharacterized protein (DUF2147 family)